MLRCGRCHGMWGCGGPSKQMRRSGPDDFPERCAMLQPDRAKGGALILGGRRDNRADDPPYGRFCNPSFAKAMFCALWRGRRFARGKPSAANIANGSPIGDGPPSAVALARRCICDRVTQGARCRLENFFPRIRAKGSSCENSVDSISIPTQPEPAALLTSEQAVRIRTSFRAFFGFPPWGPPGGFFCFVGGPPPSTSRGNGRVSAGPHPPFGAWQAFAKRPARLTAALGSPAMDIRQP